MYGLYNIVGGNLEQNIIGVILVVQNFFEIFWIDFVGVPGSPCILKVTKIRTEWSISTHYMTDMGFSNVKYKHTRVEILQYLHNNLTELAHLLECWVQFKLKIPLMLYWDFNVVKKYRWCQVVVQFLPKNCIYVTLLVKNCQNPTLTQLNSTQLKATLLNLGWG